MKLDGQLAAEVVLEELLKATGGLGSQWKNRFPRWLHSNRFWNAQRLAEKSSGDVSRI